MQQYLLLSFLTFFLFTDFEKETGVLFCFFVFFNSYLGFWFISVEYCSSRMLENKCTIKRKLIGIILPNVFLYSVLKYDYARS